MSDNGNGYVQVGVDVDDQSFAQLNTSVNSAANNLNRLAQANNAVADTADDAGSALQRAFASMKNSIDDDINSVAALRSELTGAADDAKGLAQSDSGGGSGGGSHGLARGFGAGAALARQAGSPELAGGLQVTGELLRVSKPLGALTEGLEGLAKAGGPVTDVIKDLGGNMGVLAASGGLAVVAIGLLAAGAATLKSSIDDSVHSLTAAETQLSDYYKTIETGTSSTITSDLQKRQQQQDVLQKQLDQANAANNLDQNGTGDVVHDLLLDIGNLEGRGKPIADALTTAQKAFDDNTAAIAADQEALKSSTVATNDATVAEQKLQAARDAQADKNIQIAQQTQQLEASGTTKGIQDRVAAIEAERTAINKQIEAGGLSTTETDKLSQRLRDLAAEEERDTIVIGPAIAAREKLAESEKEAAKFVTDHANAVQKQNEAEGAIVEKYNTAVQNAEDTAATARINANDKLQTALVNAAQKAVDDANKALEQLEQKRAANLQSLNQDLSKEDRASADQQLNDQVKFQRQERDDLQQHLQNLQAIRDRDAARQRDDILNRNYRDLFSLGESKTQDMGTENNRYATQEQQRKQALTDEESDQARQATASRRERLISYQQANADAQKQYTVEIAAANQAKNKAIQLAQQGYQKELLTISQGLTQKQKLLQQGVVNELKLAEQTKEQRMAILQNELNQVDELLGRTAASVNTPYRSNLDTRRTQVPIMGSGGNLYAGQTAVVNDRNRESFGGSMFPPGLGLFTPAMSGSVNPGKSGGSTGPMSNTFYITSHDAQDVRREVLTVMKELTK